MKCNEEEREPTHTEKKEKKNKRTKEKYVEDRFWREGGREKQSNTKQKVTSYTATLWHF